VEKLEEALAEVERLQAEKKWEKGRVSGTGHSMPIVPLRKMVQLTRQTATGSGLPTVDLEYTFSPPPGNNGQITTMIDHVSGERVSYTYDSLRGVSGTGHGVRMFPGF